MMLLDEIYREITAKLALLEFVESPQSEARIIICNVLSIDTKDFLLKRYDLELSDEQLLVIRSMSDLRSTGRSVQSITENAFFYGKSFYVNDHVLIPRPETELMIDEVLSRIERDKHYTILDVGSGSGVIAITLADKIDNAKVDALDVSSEALSVVQRNIDCYKSVEKKINLINKSIFDFNPDKKYDIIASNPPYIESVVVKDIIEKKIVSDPVISLDGGEDGLDFYNYFFEFALRSLHREGFMIMEHGYNQKEAIKTIADSYECFSVECIKDYSSLDRFVVVRFT